MFVSSRRAFASPARTTAWSSAKTVRTCSIALCYTRSPTCFQVGSLGDFPLILGLRQNREREGRRPSHAVFGAGSGGFAARTCAKEKILGEASPPRTPRQGL